MPSWLCDRRIRSPVPLSKMQEISGVSEATGPHIRDRVATAPAFST
jgi:hypothetical protein